MRAASLLALSVLLFTAGCGGFFVYPGSTGSGGGGTSATGDYVYVANSTTSNLAGFAVGTGTLAPVTGSPYILPEQPRAIAINPANSLLYVAGITGIYAYGIQSTGMLTALNGGLPAATAVVAAMDVTPDGQWLIALNATVSGGSGSIGVYQINSTTGGLSARATAFPVSGSAPKASAIKVAPNAQYVFAALGTSGTLVFPFNTVSGALSTPTQIVEPTNLNADNAVAVDPTSTYLYIARSGGGTYGGLAVYPIGSTGQITGSPFPTGDSQPYSVIINKAGTDVYVANKGAGTISGFSIGSNGALTALAGSPYSAGSQVIALALDNSGNYLLSAAQGGSPDLSLYSFDTPTTGKLDAAASSATGTDPTGAIALATTH